MHVKSLISAMIITGALNNPAVASAPVPAEVINTYADIALATFEDSLNSAKALQLSINSLLQHPDSNSLEQARQAWIAARVPYQQSEAFRFGNPIVDDWEGRVNAWPLDEGLIDYVDTGRYGLDSDENAQYRANIIANSTLRVAGVEVDATKITPEFIAGTLHEIDGVEANVASGYHAIEFLLWGQDLNGTEPGAGTRPATDFSLDSCTGGHCDRRRDYLVAVTTLLITDLQEMVDNWQPQGAARLALTAKDNAAAISTILTGIGSLAYGELAGERTKLGLMLHDPEEEHDCFSDNTHWSHFYDAKGIRNVYQGEYSRIDGSRITGPSLSDYVASNDAEADQNMLKMLAATEAAAQTMVDAAKQGQTFDVLIGQNNAEGNQIVQTFVDSLTEETRAIEKIIAALNLDGIELEGSDSLDNPAKVIE